jgi:3-oxoadipate enol-lactonase
MIFTKQNKPSGVYLNGRKIFHNRHFSHEENCLQFPIVLLRGLGRSSGFWLQFSEKLSMFADVHMFDLLGTGQSVSKNNFFGEWGRGSVKAHASDVVRTLRHNGLLSSHLIGISFGGMVAAAVAAQCASLKSVTIISSSARFTGESRINQTALGVLLKELKNEYPRHEKIAPYLVSESFLTQQPTLVGTWNHLYATEGFSRFAVIRQLLAAGLLHGKNEFKGILCPALYVVSTHDKLVDWRNTPVLWQSTLGAKMMILENYGHDIPTEAPAQFSESLFCYLKKTEAKT